MKRMHDHFKSQGHSVRFFFPRGDRGGGGGAFFFNFAGSWWGSTPNRSSGWMESFTRTGPSDQYLQRYFDSALINTTETILHSELDESRHHASGLWDLSI